MIAVTLERTETVTVRVMTDDPIRAQLLASAAVDNGRALCTCGGWDDPMTGGAHAEAYGGRYEKDVDGNTVTLERARPRCLVLDALDEVESVSRDPGEWDAVEVE